MSTDAIKRHRQRADVGVPELMAERVADDEQQAAADDERTAAGEDRSPHNRRRVTTAAATMGIGQLRMSVTYQRMTKPHVECLWVPWPLL